MNPVDDLTALSLTMIGEARGEGLFGMQAVGNTVMNRVARRTWYGNTPREVCLKHSKSGLYQFSCWNRRDPNSTFLLGLHADDPLYRKVAPLSQRLLDGEAEDLTNGSTHYYARGIPTPYWAKGKTPAAVIGSHYFFRDIE